MFVKLIKILQKRRSVPYSLFATRINANLVFRQNNFESTITKGFNNQEENNNKKGLLFIFFCELCVNLSTNSKVFTTFKVYSIALLAKFSG